VSTRDMSKVTVAYEPIWAIGTGRGSEHRMGTSTRSADGILEEM
jgi:triosephosphate isomerase